MGQAIWFDHIRRAFTESGRLQGLLDLGVAPHECLVIGDSPSRVKAALAAGMLPSR